MSREMTTTNDKVFYQPFGGAFRTRVQEGHPDAIVRTLTKGKNAGKQVWEKETSALFGIIEDVSFEDAEFEGGKVKQLKITLDKNEDGKHPVITFTVESKEGRDMIKRLPAVDFAKEVRIMPYRFTGDDGKELSGVSLHQQDDEGRFTVKIDNFFFDGETKEYKHDFPVIDWDAASESERKIYKIQRDEFLVNYLEKNVLPGFSEKKKPLSAEFDYPEESIDPEDLPAF